MIIFKIIFVFIFFYKAFSKEVNLALFKNVLRGNSHFNGTPTTFSPLFLTDGKKYDIPRSLCAFTQKPFIFIVDLQGWFLINKIVIFTPMDCCAEENRGSGAGLAGKVINGLAYVEHICGEFPETKENSSYTAFCHEKKPYRWVVLYQRQKRKEFGLAEAEVFGEIIEKNQNNKIYFNVGCYKKEAAPSKIKKIKIKIMEECFEYCKQSKLQIVILSDDDECGCREGPVDITWDTVGDCSETCRGELYMCGGRKSVNLYQEQNLCEMIDKNTCNSSESSCIYSSGRAYCLCHHDNYTVAPYHNCLTENKVTKDPKIQKLKNKFIKTTTKTTTSTSAFNKIINFTNVKSISKIIRIKNTIQVTTQNTLTFNFTNIANNISNNTVSFVNNLTTTATNSTNTTENYFSLEGMTSTSSIKSKLNKLKTIKNKSKNKIFTKLFMQNKQIKLNIFTNNTKKIKLNETNLKNNFSTKTFTITTKQTALEEITKSVFVKIKTTPTTITKATTIKTAATIKTTKLKTKINSYVNKHKINNNSKIKTKNINSYKNTYIENEKTTKTNKITFIFTGKNLFSNETRPITSSSTKTSPFYSKSKLFKFNSTFKHFSSTTVTRFFSFKSSFFVFFSSFQSSFSSSSLILPPSSPIPPLIFSPLKRLKPHVIQSPSLCDEPSINKCNPIISSCVQHLNITYCRCLNTHKVIPHSSHMCACTLEISFIRQLLDSISENIDVCSCSYPIGQDLGGIICILKNTVL